MRNKKNIILVTMLLLLVAFSYFTTPEAHAVEVFPFGEMDLGETTEGTSNTVKILTVLTVLSLAPSILIMMTAFTRIIIVLSFLRNALGLQQTPPNQVIVGLALFLTFFVMSPVVTDISTNAYQPFMEGRITQEEALDNAEKPIKEFMLEQTYKKDLNMFVSMSQIDKPEELSEIPMSVVIPSFITSELKRAFQMGFLIYVPFIVIDMIVASTLMAMGMMMLPPAMISLPFKILLFVLVDGWGLVIKTLVSSFGV